ncbi:MAG: aldose 1-epimerase [Actinomycetota bacterium]|jgi:aldose 1-epimerase|nr:aldose 1-epimerase [Actinomycetota bacterium]
MRAPTGEQFRLTRSTPHGLAEAVIVEVAASIREFRIGTVELTEPYGEFSMPPFADGIVLVPWPNRIEDGVWELDGVHQQLDITEPDKHNAIHGLLRFASYRVLERTDGSITLGATIFPQHGYPFLLETSVRHELTDDGMTITHRITNESDLPAPVAIGAHPFFQLGDVPTEDLTLTVHAGTRFPVDERLNVSAEIPVVGDYDLRDGRKVADVNLDDAFGDVTPVNQVTAQLTAPDGRSVALWQDENFPYVQIFTTRKFPRGTGFVTAIAMEPMTAPANAFNSGQSLKWLNPGETWQAAWGIRYTAA